MHNLGRIYCASLLRSAPLKVRAFYSGPAVSKKQEAATDGSSPSQELRVEQVDSGVGICCQQATSSLLVLNPCLSEVLIILCSPTV